MEWPPALIDRLRTLWDEGHSVAEIGRRLGISKNAAMGKVHRLNLPGRPSPIKPSADRRPKAIPRAMGPTLASFAEPAVLLPRAEPKPARKLEEPAGLVVPCQWPIGEPRAKDFRFCGVPSQPGKSYCPEHCSIAYVKTRRVDAEAPVVGAVAFSFHRRGVL